MKPIRKFLTATVAALVVMAFSAATAQALCPYSGAEQVFRPWGDVSYYVLAPDGGFEDGAEGWSLSGGAFASRGNEPFYLNDPSDKRSLRLPAGSSAVTPPICMSIDTPTFRLLARNTGDTSSALRIEAVYELLGLRTKVVSDVSGGSEWEPTDAISTVLTLSTVVGTLTPSEIEIRLRPLGSGGRWQVDDLYVDPFSRR